MNPLWRSGSVNFWQALSRAHSATIRYVERQAPVPGIVLSDLDLAKQRMLAEGLC